MKPLHIGRRYYWRVERGDLSVAIWCARRSSSAHNAERTSSESRAGRRKSWLEYFVIISGVSETLRKVSEEERREEAHASSAYQERPRGVGIALVANLGGARDDAFSVSIESYLFSHLRSYYTTYR